MDFLLKYSTLSVWGVFVLETRHFPHYMSYNFFNADKKFERMWRAPSSQRESLSEVPHYDVQARCCTKELIPLRKSMSHSMLLPEQDD